MMSQNASKYLRFRAGLVHRGLSLRAWAQTKGYPISTVYDAARGTRKGNTSKRIKAELEEYLNA